MSGVTSQERQTWSARYIYRCARETPPADGLVRETRPSPPVEGQQPVPNKVWISFYFWRLATPARCTTSGCKKKGGTLGPQS